MENTLIGMTDFVLEQNKIYGSTPYDAEPDPCHVYIDRCNAYANFLKQPLTLEMFIACDEDGNVLEEPKQENYKEMCFYEVDVDIYRQAQSRVLFEGFEIKTNPVVESIKYIGFHPNQEPIFMTNRNDNWVQPVHGTFKTIEDLIPYNITLTLSVINRMR